MANYSLRAVFAAPCLMRFETVYLQLVEVQHFPEEFFFLHQCLYNAFTFETVNIFHFPLNCISYLF